MRDTTSEAKGDRGGRLLIWRTQSIDGLEEKEGETEVDLRVPANRQAVVAPIACA